MNAITLGNPNLFVKGMVEVVITDPDTGNIIGYDNVASESAVNTSVNMGEITGGFGNPLLMNIPDTTRITGSLTSQAFSLQQRALMTGGSISSNGVIPYCETVRATNNQIVPTRRLKKFYGQTAWGYLCYIRKHGATTFEGAPVAFDNDSPTITVLNYPALQNGIQYDIMYFTSWADAQVLTLPTSFIPTVATVRLKYGVYAKQNNSVSNGTLQGYLYFVVPRAQFTGDAGIAANQTTNSTTNYDWTAITPDNNMMDCSVCGNSGSDYAYYIYVPCGDEYQSVVDVVVIGGGVTFKENEDIVGSSKKLPIAFVTNSGDIIQNVDISQFDPRFVRESPGDNYYTIGDDGLVTIQEVPSNVDVAIPYRLTVTLSNQGDKETLFTVFYASV